MGSYIVRYGIIAGLIVGIPMIIYFGLIPVHPDVGPSMLITYVAMLVALSMVFVAIKQYRDRALGGTIQFMPAFIIGLGVSAVAGVFYSLAWEISTMIMKFDFAEFYAKHMVEEARASGADAQGIAAAAAKAAEFTKMYANPFFRLPMTFLEIFPVGILVSLISAGLLRNSRLLPAKPA